MRLVRPQMKLMSFIITQPVGEAAERRSSRGGGRTPPSGQTPQLHTDTCCGSSWLRHTHRLYIDLRHCEQADRLMLKHAVMELKYFYSSDVLKVENVNFMSIFCFSTLSAYFIFYSTRFIC